MGAGGGSGPPASRSRRTHGAVPYTVHIKNVSNPEAEKEARYRLRISIVLFPS